MLFKESEMPFLIPRKGLIIELLQIQSSAAIPWKMFARWVYKFFGQTPPTPTADALRRLVSNLKKRRQYLLKNPAKREDLKLFLEESFTLPRQGPGSAAKATVATPQTATVAKIPQQPSQTEVQAIKTVNKSLAKEVHELQDICKTQQADLDDKERKIRTLEQQYKPHNVRRRIQRKDVKLTQLKEEINRQASELKQQEKQATKRAREQARYYKRKCEDRRDIELECDVCKELEEELSKLKARNRELLEANAILVDEVTALKSRKLTTYEDGKYTDSMRLCIMDILSHNVGINQIEPVIRSVLRLVNVECNRIPQHTAISQMLLESRALSQIQLVKTLSESDQCNTLHSDGTTKFGHKYTGYQISTAETALTLGLQVNVTYYDNVITITHKCYHNKITQTHVGSGLWGSTDHIRNLTGNTGGVVSNSFTTWAWVFRCR